MSTDLTHWHGSPSALAEPAECCKTAFNAKAAKELEEAVHAERRRVITTALDVVEAYGANIVTVLSGEAAELTAKLTKHAADAIRKTGCICPRIDTTTFGGPPSWTRGFDGRCGMHKVGTS